MIDVWFSGPRPRRGDRIRSVADAGSGVGETPVFSVETALVSNGQWGVRIDLDAPSALSEQAIDTMTAAFETQFGGTVAADATEMA